MASVLGSAESTADDNKFKEARTFNHSAASDKTTSGGGELGLAEMFFAGLLSKDRVVTPALNGTVLPFVSGKQLPEAARAVHVHTLRLLHAKCGRQARTQYGSTVVSSVLGFSSLCS